MKSEDMILKAAIVHILDVELREKKNTIVVTYKNGTVTKWRAMTRDNARLWVKALDAARKALADEKYYGQSSGGED